MRPAGGFAIRPGRIGMASSVDTDEQGSPKIRSNSSALEASYKSSKSSKFPSCFGGVNIGESEIVMRELLDGWGASNSGPFGRIAIGGS